MLEIWRLGSGWGESKSSSYASITKGQGRQKAIATASTGCSSWIQPASLALQKCTVLIPLQEFYMLTTTALFTKSSKFKNCWQLYLIGWA